MKNFESLSDLMTYMNKVGHQSTTELNNINNYAPENLLFVASKEMKMKGEKLYGLVIERITLFPLKNVKMNAAIHIFLPSQDDIINFMIEDIGNYIITASWGFSDDDTSDPDIYEWKHNFHSILLRKRVRSVIDYELTLPQDVITVSSDLYENTRDSSYWKE